PPTPMSLSPPAMGKTFSSRPICAAALDAMNQANAPHARAAERSANITPQEKPETVVDDVKRRKNETPRRQDAKTERFGSGSGTLKSLASWRHGVFSERHLEQIDAGGILWRRGGVVDDVAGAGGGGVLDERDGRRDALADAHAAGCRLGEAAREPGVLERHRRGDRAPV